MSGSPRWVSLAVRNRNSKMRILGMQHRGKSAQGCDHDSEYGFEEPCDFSQVGRRAMHMQQTGAGRRSLQSEKVHVCIPCFEVRTRIETLCTC